MIRLSVNLNKVATLRNARGGERPGVLDAARIVVDAGAHGLTVHPRPDQRHIRRSDVLELAAWLARIRSTGVAAAGLEFNIEGYPSPDWLGLVEEVRPAQATLVPDPPEALTSNAGWRFATVDRGWLGQVVARLKAAGCRVSLFLDPDPEEVAGARDAGADRIELYTEAYARAFATPERELVLDRYRATAARAGEAGLGLNAGHDLDLDNLPLFARAIPGLEEVSIGHALISDALLGDGLAATVAAYLAALRK